MGSQWIALLTGLLLWSIWQGAKKVDDKLPAETKVPRTRQVLTIDGVLNAPAWRRAPSLLLQDL